MIVLWDPLSVYTRSISSVFKFNIVYTYRLKIIEFRVISAGL